MSIVELFQSSTLLEFLIMYVAIIIFGTAIIRGVDYALGKIATENKEESDQ